MDNLHALRQSCYDSIDELRALVTLKLLWDALSASEVDVHSASATDSAVLSYRGAASTHFVNMQVKTATCRAPDAVIGKLMTRSMATDPNGSSCVMVVSGFSHGLGALLNLWHCSHDLMYSLTSSDNPFQKTARINVS